MSKYKVDYKDVECTDVDWGRSVFTLVYNYKHFKYKPSKFTRYDNDEKTIRGVIDRFLDEMGTRGIEHYCNALSLIGERAGEVGEEMYGAKEKTKLYLQAQRDALDWVYKHMLYIEDSQREEDDDE